MNDLRHMHVAQFVKSVEHCDTVIAFYSSRMALSSASMLKWTDSNQERAYVAQNCFCFCA